MSRQLRALCASRLFIEALENRKLLSAGQLDPSFSGDGKATATFKTGGFIDIDSVATTSDGKTIAVGNAGVVTDDIAVARFNFDGSLDTTFGTARSGIIQIHPVGDSNNSNVAQAVAIDGQGRIVVVGAAGDNFLALRFMPNGQLDKSFDHDGIATIEFGITQRDQANAVAIQSNGKIVLAGEGGLGGKQVALARLNTNGSVDTTFGTPVLVAGKVTHLGRETIDFGDNSFANAVGLDYTGSQTSPKIVVVGDFEAGSQQKVEVVRLNNNGSLDHSFDQDGILAFSVPTHNVAAATGIVIQGGGKYVVTGTSGPDPTNAVFFAVRLNSSGSIDNTFGDAGNGIELIGFGGLDEAWGVTVGLNDRLFIAGSVGSEIAIVALTKDGVRDTSFGTAGKVTTATGLIGQISTVGVAYLGDRLVVDGGIGSTMNVLRFLDINPTVAVTAINTTASEQGQTPVSFIVSRDQRLPFDTLIDFTIGGTATAPTLAALKNHTNDYALSGMSIPHLAIFGHPLGPPFVDIPANQTFVIVTLTPLDDSTKEGTETAIFGINGDTSYTTGVPNSATINILDNDIAASTTLATTADAYVQDGSNASVNFGSAPELQVKKAGSGFNRVSYLKFDLSGVSTIGSAKLELFGDLSDTKDASIATSAFSVADTSWTESGITFSNAPALSASPLVTTTITGTTGAMYTWDVTSYLQAQKAAGHNLVSLALKDLSNSSSIAKLHSKEAPANPPILVISAAASGAVGTFKISSPHTVPAGQSADVAVTWTVPSGGWRQLHTIDLQLRGDDGSLNRIEWDQENNTLALLDPDTGEFGAAKVFGSNDVLSNSRIDVLLKTSFMKASGPTSPIVTVTFSLRFKQAGHHYSVEAAASNDNGNQTMFGLGKSITVT